MIKIGFTSYSFSKAVNAGTIDFLKSIELAAEYGAEHIEIARDLSVEPELIEQIKATAKAQNLALSSYTVGANFVQPDTESVRKEVERIKGQIEIGEGKRKSEDIMDILEAKDRRKAGITANPEGLYLRDVYYN